MPWEYLSVEALVALGIHRKALGDRLSVQAKNDEVTGLASAPTDGVPRTRAATVTVGMTRGTDPVLVLVLGHRTVRDAVGSVAGVLTTTAVVRTLQRNISTTAALYCIVCDVE